MLCLYEKVGWHGLLKPRFWHADQPISAWLTVLAHKQVKNNIKFTFHCKFFLDTLRVIQNIIDSKPTGKKILNKASNTYIIFINKNWPLNEFTFPFRVKCIFLSCKNPLHLRPVWVSCCITVLHFEHTEANLNKIFYKKSMKLLYTRFHNKGLWCKAEWGNWLKYSISILQFLKSSSRIPISYM